MNASGNSLSDHYSALSNEELKQIAITGGLTSAAQEALEQELDRRGITHGHLNEYWEEVRDSNRARVEKTKTFVTASANSVKPIVLGCAAFVGNFLAALSGVGQLKNLTSLLVKLFTHSRASIILTEWIGSIFFAVLIGHSVQRRWRTRTARWIWIPTALLFSFGLIQGLRVPHGNPWLALSAIGYVRAGDSSYFQFAIYTVPLVRTLAYSLAAFFTARSSIQTPAKFHPVLSQLLSGLYLVGLPKPDIEQNSTDEPLADRDTTK